MNRSKVKRIFERIYPHLCILGIVIAILYSQIKGRICLTGCDAWFHMNQFYDTAMQFKTGHFSYFISLFGFGGIGRIVNAIYGPGFVYLGGFILLLAKTWYRFEIVQDFLGLFFGGLFFYRLARKNYVTRLIGTLLSVLYIMSSVVMTWVINQEFNGVEAILMPLIMLQATQMVRKKRIQPLALGLTMAVVFQTHMMTTLMGTLTLIPFFIYTWYRTTHKKLLWEHLLMSIGLTALLTANVWGAMLNVIPQGLVPPVPQGMPGSGGSITFMVPGHYFSVLGFIYSIIVATFLIGGLASLLLWKRSNSFYKMILFVGIFIIWMSSTYFPWRLVYKIYPAFTYQIQFPKRFLSSGIILLFLAIGMLFSNHDVHLVGNRQLNKIMIMIAQVILIVFVGAGYIYQHELMLNSFAHYTSEKVIDYSPFYIYHSSHKMARKIRNSYYSFKLSTSLNLVHQSTPDYLPTHNVIHTYYQYRKSGLYSGVQRQIYGNIKYLHVHKHVSNNRITMTWHQKHTTRNDILPVTKYRDTQVILNHHLLKHLSISRIGMLRVNRISKGRNTVSISYRAPMWLHVLMGLTILSWLGLIMWLIYLVCLKYS